MTDIVERLRGGVTKWGGVDCAPDAILAAADEIERLRAALRAMVSEATVQGWREDCVLAVMLDEARAALGENKHD